MNTANANQRWMKTIVWGVSKKLIHELKRLGGINFPNISGHVSETCPALSPAVIAPYEIWMISRINAVKASLEGKDQLAFLFLAGKPYLCPKAVHRLKPSSES